MKYGMMVEITEDRFGNLKIGPVSKKWQERIQKQLECYGEAWDGFVYIQDNTEMVLEEWFECGQISRGEIGDLHSGWSVNKLFGVWEFLQGYVGYDAGDSPEW